MQDAGFPIMKSMTRTETDPDIRRARGNEQGRHRSQRWLIGPHNDVALPAVSVCVQYLYRDGYSLRHMSDFAAWYLLLGVKRILVFDNMEPDRMPAGEVRVRAARHHADLMALSTSLGDRFQVIRGLCMYDTMRRAPLNANCQVLAGNIALQAVRAADAAHPAAYVLMADFDEYLVPPIRVRAGNVWDANVSGERPSTSKGGSITLAGALGARTAHFRWRECHLAAAGILAYALSMGHVEHGREECQQAGNFEGLASNSRLSTSCLPAARVLSK